MGIQKVQELVRADILMHQKIDDEQKAKKKRRNQAQIIEEKKIKLAKLQKQLADLNRSSSRAARKTRDTAIYTAGACILAGLESNDLELRREVKSMWLSLANSFPLEITDRRRTCLDQTALALPIAENP